MGAGDTATGPASFRELLMTYRRYNLSRIGTTEGFGAHEPVALLAEPSYKRG